MCGFDKDWRAGNWRKVALGGKKLRAALNVSRCVKAWSSMGRC